MTTHKIPHYGNNSKMKKNTTLWEQFQNEKKNHNMETIPK
jgi:hypothetical protein